MSFLESEFTIGRYRVIKRIGSNGCTLYVAANLILDKPAFLRSIPCHNCPPESIALFLKEIRLLGRINHPNIIKIHDCFQRDTDLFLVTEYVNAPTLFDLFHNAQRMNQLELILMAEQCLDALAYLHKMGFEYDVMEPQKIYLLDSGKTMIEFPGLSHLISMLDPDYGRLIVSNVSLLYVSPEKIRLDRGDIRSDLYSFGLVMYEALSGRNRRSFVSSASGLEFVRFAMEENFPPIREIAPDVSVSLARVIDKTIQRDPDRRFQTARELLQALRES